MINNTRNLSKATIAKDVQDRFDTPEGVSVETTKAFTDITDVTPATTDNYYEHLLNPTKPKSKKEEDNSSAKGTSNSPLSVFSAMAEISPDTNTIQTAQSRPFDFTKYGDGSGENLGVVHTDAQMNRGRAEDQSGWEQARNAIGRVGLNVLPEIVSQVANILDVEDYVNTDAEVGNWLNTAMQNVEKDVDEALPIYRENPDKPLDYKDSAWWFENGSSLVKSAAAFAAVGFATGGAVSPLFAEAGFMSKFLNPNALKLGSALTTATALNQAEGIGIATDTFNQSYEQELLKLQSSSTGSLLSPEEMDIQAKEIASEKATSALNFNKWNILLNITSAGLFMKTPTSINQLAKQTNLKNTLGHIGLEGGQEYLEETINDISTNQALDDSYGLGDALEYAATSKGIESGLLGFVGGAGQTGLTLAGKMVPMYNNSAYNKAYTDAYNKIKGSDITDEQKSAQASKEALEKAGSNKSRVSANFLNDQRYIQQQKELVKYNNMSNSEKITDVTTAFSTAKETTELQKQIATARNLNETVKADELEKRLFSQQVYNAFETGTTDGFTELYKGYKELNHEEANARGIYKEGDETKPIYYKKKAQQALDTIDTLGKIYIDSSKYINNHQVYNLAEQKLSTKNTIADNKIKLDNIVKQAEEDYKHIADIRLGEGESSYRDIKSISGYNINKFPVKFRFTSAYKQIKSLNKAIEDLQDNVNTLQQVSDTVTSSDFQDQLAKRIKNSIKSDEKAVKQQEIKNKAINTKLENKAIKTNLETKVVNTDKIIEEKPTTSSTNLPVNENVVESVTEIKTTPTTKASTPINKTIPKSIQNVKFPVFNDPGFDSMLSGTKNIIDSYDYYEEDKLPQVEQVYNQLLSVKDQFLTSFPLKANEYNKTLETLQTSIDAIKSNIQGGIQDKVVAKQNAQALMNSFQEIPVNETLESDNSPSTNPNFEKADQQYQLLKTVLGDAFNQGIDNTEGEEDYFRNIVNYLQDLTTKDEVINYFIPLKNLFNVVTGSNIEGTYQEIMLSPLEQQEIINTLNKVALFSVPQGTYTFELDSISKFMLEELNKVASMQGVNTEDNGMSFTVYNEMASNLLAYLVKDYNVKFTSKKDKNGNPYIAVTKEDVNNLLNTILDQRVLNPNIIKQGTKVEFRGLDSVTLEDGSTLYAKDVDYANKPIGVFVDGSLVEGLYLHDPSWINVTNVDNTKEGIEADQAKLLALKTYIIDNPQIIHSTTITNRTAGVPILDSTGKSEPVGVRMPEVQVGIIQNGQVRLNRNEVASVLPHKFSEGKSVTIIPFGSNQLALPAKRTKLNLDHRNSILSAVQLYIEGKPTNVTNRLKSEHNIDILTSIGLEQYMNMFINLGKLNAKTVNEYTLALNTLNDGIVLTQFSNVKGIGTQLLFGEGSGIDVGYISKNKYVNQEGDLTTDLAQFSNHLEKLYNHVNLDLLGSDTVIPVIQGDDIITDYPDYDSFVKSIMLTPYLSLTLEDGTKVYSIQGRIHFDLDAVYNNKPSDINNVSYENTDLNIERLSDLDKLTLEQKNQLKIQVKQKIDQLPNDVFFLTHLTQTNENLQGILKNGLNTGIAIESTTNISSNKEGLYNTISSLIDGKIRHADSSNLIILAFPKFLINEGAKKSEYTEAVSNYIAENYPSNFGKNIPNSFNIATFSNGEIQLLNENNINITPKFIPFETPDGRTINFNDVDLDEDFSLDIEESNKQYSAGGRELNIDALEKASFSIKGVPLSTQISLIRTISNSVQTEIIENPSSSFNVAKQVNLFMQGLQLTKQQAYDQGFARADKVAEQVDIITQPENVKLIINEVRTSLSKKKNIKIASDNSDEIEIETGDENEKAFEQEFTVDPKVGMTDTIRLWFEGFTEKKIIKGELRERTNMLGLKSFIPFDESYNDVLGLLAKSNTNTGYISPDVSMNRKFDTSTQVQPTYIVNILNKLEEHIEDKPYFLDVINKLRYAEPHVQNQFNSTFNVTHTNHIFLQDSYDSTEKIRQLKPISSSARNVTNLVISEWQTSLKNTGFYTINKEKVEVTKPVLDRFKSIYSSIVKGETIITESLLNAWLQPIGIVFPDNFYNRLDTKGLKQNDVVYSLMDMFTLPNGIFKNIHDRVVKFDNENPNALSLEDSNLYEDSSFKELANLISYYRKDLFNKAFKNGNGDTVNGFTNAKRVIEQGLKLKSDIQQLWNLKKDVFSQDSTWLKGLLSTNQQDINKEGLMYKYFNYFTVDSFKLKKNQKGKVVDTLKEKELERLSLGLFYNQGLSIGKTGTKIPIHKFLFNTMSDKAAVVGYQAPGRHYTFNQIVDQFGSVIKEEMNDKDKEYLVKTLFFPEMTRILKYQESIGTDNEVQIAEYSQGAGKFLMFPELNNIHSLFEGREVDAEGNITEQGLLKPNVLTEPRHMVSLKQAVYEHIMNEYQIKEALWKKFDIITEYGGQPKLQYIDNSYLKAFPDADYKNTLFNYVVNYMVANMNFQQLFIGDIALYTKGNALSTSDNLGKRLASMSAGQTPYNNYNEKFNVLVVADDVQKSTAFDYIQSSLIKVHGEEIGRELSKGYEFLKASDAQEYTSLEEHMNLLFAEGKISKDIKDSVIEYYNQTGELRKGDYKVVLQPTKPVYTNNFMRSAINSSLYIKSSSIPLIKSLTQGTELDKFREVLDNEDLNIQRIAFKTAVKIGQPKSVLNPFKENGRVEFPTDFEYSIIRDIPRDGHGVQQAVPYDADNNIVNDGTQQAKEWLTNFMDVDGFINPITGSKVKGRELNKTYIDLYSKLFTMKHSALVKELAFDVNSGYIGNLPRLKKLIVDEGLSRNYNSNDVQSMELNDLEDKFTVPLWLNNSDSKIVSLLNSIVDNRIRKRKFRGKSLVLASNTGLQTIEQFQGNGITTIPGFNGTPKATYNSDGQMVSAEILIPFKFWDNKGKALSLNQFINEEGTIDLTKLPEDLLEIFGYRIPTSGVNLMSNLKIVGFLPEGYGDIVIAPADFIEQMGSDFDVDKLYTHMYNTYYNEEENTLVKLDQTHVDRFNNIKKSINLLNNRINKLEEGGIKSIEDNRLAYELRRRVREFRNSTISSLDNPEEMLIQNQLLDLHKAVLNNPSIDVQSARMKPLSFGELPQLAKDFAKGLNSKFFTVTNDSYQKMKYLSARSGKSAVGNFSLNMVFNSVVQQVEQPMNFMDGDNRIIYNIGGQQSNFINDIKTINGSKFKSDVHEAFMASALDNENEQLLGKLNINNETFDFIRAGVQLGYDENTIITLINQPIIKDYVEKTGLNIAVKSDEFGDRQKLAIKTLNIEQLKENINTQVIDTDEQKAILSFFLTLSLKGKELKTLQSAINSDSSGIGKNMFYSMRKAEQILNLQTKTSISHASELIGDYIDLNTNPEYNNLSTTLGKSWIKERIKEGYFKQGHTLIKPNTLGGLAGVYGTIFNTQLWSQLYPYTDSKLYSIITSVQQGKQDRKESINEESKELQESVTNYKSLMISNAYDLAGSYNNIFEARQDLLFDSLTHMSLGSIISNLRTTNTYTNPFLDRLQIGRSSTGIDVTGKVPTDINYYNASSNEYDEEILLKTVIDMITNPKPLGEFNGQSLDTRSLMEKLATHQFITGGIQKSSQFVKYIPFEYLKQIGYYDDLKTNSRLGQTDIGVKSIKDIYRTQMVQHFPESYYDSALDNVNDIITDGRLLPVEKLYNDIVVKKDSLSDRFLIFKQDPITEDYFQIDNLGSNGLMEWDINAGFAGKSNIWLNQVEQRNEPEYIHTLPVLDTIDKPIKPLTKVGDIIEVDFDFDDNNITVQAEVVSIDKYTINDGRTYNYNVVLRNTKSGKIYDFHSDSDGIVFSTISDSGKVAASVGTYMKISLPSDNQRVVISEEYIPVEDNEIANFLRIDRSTLHDVTPNVYNRETKSLIQQYGLDDSNISITSKYTGILEQTIQTNPNPITVQFAKELLQVVDYIAETPLYINTRLKAKGITYTTRITGEPVRIEINPTVIKSDLELQNILIEEMTHAVLKQELRKDNSEFVNNIDNIRNQIIDSLSEQEEKEFEDFQNRVRKNLPLKGGKEKEFYYNLINNDEFVAGAIKDKSFQQYLNNQEGTNTTKSLWSKFIDSIKKLLVKLGVNDNSTLGAVIDNTLSLFKNVDKTLAKSLTSPKYIRTVEWVNEKFNLSTDDGILLSKLNANEIVGFINSYIVNIEAKVIEGDKILVESKTVKNLVQDFAVDYSEMEYNDSQTNNNEGIGGSLKIYLENIQDRINRLSTNITKAEQAHDNTRVAELMERRNKETLRIEDIKDVASVAALADKGREDLDLVNNIMNRPMTSEDINYTRSIVNFWRNARENIFQEKHKSSKILTEMYGAIEGTADVMHDKLFGIEKTYLEGFIKQQFGKDASIDDIFNKYKDISWDKANLRDISQYDNLLLNSVWSSIKEANINALTEGEVKIEALNESLQKVLPQLKQLNKKSPFELFRQLTASGKKTNQLVKPFTHSFYKDRYKEYNNVIKNNNTTTLNNYANWISNNGVNTKLASVFPADGKITDEVNKAREDLKAQLGTGIYNQWFKNQQKKLNKYETNKEGYLNYLMGEYKMTKLDEIKTNKDAINRYQFWLKLNSPYNLNDVIFKGKKLDKDLVNYNSQNYYEMVPKDENYLDSNYQTISNDENLLQFYDQLNSLFTDLAYYVPENQQKVIAYGGIPSIEKSLFEMYSDKGMELGFAPIYNTFIQSMQTSFNESSISATDFATGKPRQDMRIPILKDNYSRIMEYVSAQEAEYIVRKQTFPSPETIKGFEEDIVAQIAEETSFDLGKVAKVYTALVMAYKHKASLQDTINIANNVMGSYGETILRPDGTPLTNRVTGQSEKKLEAESFIKTKQAFDSYVQNVLYGNIKEEEGKGKIIYTKADKNRQKELELLLEELEVNYQTGNMEESLYESTKTTLEDQLNNLGKTLIYSKAGDNILKYLQLKLMGWNALGGLGNMAFGWIANTIESAGGVHFNQKDLAYAYKLTGNSVLKNWTFNKVQTETAEKIRNMMDTMDVLKDSSYELYTDSVKGELATKLKFLSPFNISQRSEYLNQAPLMIALFRNTEVDTDKGKINLYEGFNKDGSWNTAEYGDAPTELINRTRIKLDKLIVQVHGNYDNLSPIQAKRNILGRAASQFRNFLFEAYYTRFENERFDPNLDQTVKGRYKSVVTTWSNSNKVKFGSEVLKGILNQVTFGRFNIGDFNSLKNDNIKDIDVINMKKVAMEAALAIEVQLFLLLLTGFGKDEDDEDGIYNVLFNQGVRMRTDLLLYINPNEAKNIIKDLIPAMSVLKDTTDWFSAVGGLIWGEDTIQTGVHEGNSKVGTATAKMIPFVAKVYSTYNSASQSFTK